MTERGSLSGLQLCEDRYPVVETGRPTRPSAEQAKGRFGGKVSCILAAARMLFGTLPKKVCEKTFQHGQTRASVTDDLVFSGGSA